jgi:hypothetical protein
MVVMMYGGTVDVNRLPESCFRHLGIKIYPILVILLDYRNEQSGQFSFGSSLSHGEGSCSRNIM